MVDARPGDYIAFEWDDVVHDVWLVPADAADPCAMVTNSTDRKQKLAHAKARGAREIIAASHHATVTLKLSNPLSRVVGFLDFVCHATVTLQISDDVFGAGVSLDFVRLATRQCTPMARRYTPMGAHVRGAKRNRIGRSSRLLLPFLCRWRP